MIRHAYGIPSPAANAANAISVADTAARLGRSTGVLYYWIDNARRDAHGRPAQRAG